MNKTNWIFIAVALVAAGLIIFAVVMSVLGWDFTKLSTSKFETNTHEITENFDSISVDASTADIRFLPSGDGGCRVVCHEMEKVRHEVTIKDGVLTVKEVDTRAWYEHIGINFSTQTVTVYLPLSEYGELLIRASTGYVEIQKDFRFRKIDVSLSTGDVNAAASCTDSIKIKTTTGSITVDGVSADALDLSASTGSITVKGASVTGDIKATTSTGSARISNTECKTLTATASTGSIYLSGTIASISFNLEAGTGSICFDASDAAEIYAKTGTGSVYGTLLSDKDFETRTATGTVDVPNNTEGGICDIETGTGDIRISIVASPQ